LVQTPAGTVEKLHTVQVIGPRHDTVEKLQTVQVIGSRHDTRSAPCCGGGSGPAIEWTVPHSGQRLL